MNQLGNVLIYGTLAGLTTLIGVYLVLAKESWARRNSIFLISFSAGILLSVAFTHLIPEAQTLNSRALIWLLASFLFFYILEHSIIMHSCHEKENCEIHPIDKIALLGMGFHSLLDGIVIGIGFEISFTLGLMAALSILLHKLPDGISMTAILLHSEYSRRQAVRYSWLIALVTPIGAWLSYFFLGNLSSQTLGIFLAAAAGSFLYLAAADLIPEIHKKSQFLNIVLVILGVAFPFVIRFLKT